MFYRPIVLVFAFYSFWFPQIAYSAYSGSRQSLDNKVICGLSMTRLLLPLYILACPSNIFTVMYEDYIQPSYSTAILLILWIALQTVILVCQV
jgi:hypothetical protein